MSRINHPSAIVEEEGEPITVVVRVDLDLLDQMGDELVYDAISNHPWVQQHDLPLVLGYDFEGELSFIGPEDLADVVADRWDGLRWKSKVSIDWDEVQDEYAEDDEGWDRDEEYDEDKYDDEEEEAGDEDDSRD